MKYNISIYTYQFLIILQCQGRIPENKWMRKTHPLYSTINKHNLYFRMYGTLISYFIIKPIGWPQQLKYEKVKTQIHRQYNFEALYIMEVN